MKEPNANRKQPGRLIALEVRPRYFGFTVFERPTMLLDWGVREAPRAQSPESTIAARVGLIFGQYNPSILVLRRRTDQKAQRSKNLDLVLTEIVKCAGGRGIPVHWMNTSSVHALFAPHGYKTRFEIASAITEIFEELVWKLPRKRKAWQNDKPNMLIFDATAVGLAYFAQAATEERLKVNAL
jgi:hypothetical protein